MKITQEENNILLEELTRVISKPTLNKLHEVTINMLVESSGRTERVCSITLEKKVLHEGWKKHAAIDDRGFSVNAYYNPKLWSPEAK